MEGQKLTSLGGTLPVPCVQELTKKMITTVPPRYLRPELHPPLLNINSTSSFSSIHVPVIDFNSLVSGDSMDLELEKLHCACKDWGFFQLMNHGVSSSLLEKVKVEVREFFNLPLEEKKRFFHEPGDVQGFGQAFVISEEQKLDWADML